MPEKGIFQKVILTPSLHSKEKVSYMGWTREMDSCVARTLASQIAQGINAGGSLRPEAYTVAATTLKDKFGIVLNNDFIRNRVKTWKKQFGILKELLAHNGFRWDDELKMVVADDSAWDHYVKMHPDARQFRGRSVENYEELCVIIGNDQIEEGCGDNDNKSDLRWIGNKDGMETVLVAESQNDDKQMKKLRWTEGMDNLLGEILVEQVRTGRRINHMFQAEAYDNVLRALNEKYCTELTKDHIRNRLKTWKKQHGTLKELLSHAGFKWDETRRMIVAHDSVWNDYVKTHPDARLFRGKVIENYDHLCVIYGNYNEPTDISPTQGRKVKDRGKNLIWTTEMDYYLSKILVEQVRIGNKSKLDNKLNPAAYVAAISAMNERFQLHLTKDHIKNHLKTWKKQFDILKELLDRDDFDWDETTKMIIASDRAWNQFIRKNPDVRHFQGRVITNYAELCIIIGSDDPPENSLNGDDDSLDFTVDDYALDVDSAFHKQGDLTTEKSKYCSWTYEMDRCLTEQLLEQVFLGNRPGRKFKAIAYTAALAVLNEKFDLELTRENIMNRLKTWKKQYGLVKELLTHSGFEWDERLKMIVASDSKWNEYIEINPEAKHLRARSIENFNEWGMIVGNESPIRNQYETGAKSAEHPFLPSKNNEDQMETPLHILDDEEETRHDDAGNDDQGSSHQTRARPSSSHSQQPCKRLRTDDIMVEAITTIATNLGRIADALTENNNVCLDAVFEIVQRIPGFDDDLIIEACEYLSSEEKKARMFMKLDDRLRRKWLLRQLRGQSSGS